MQEFYFNISEVHEIFVAVYCTYSLKGEKSIGSIPSDRA